MVELSDPGRRGDERWGVQTVRMPICGERAVAEFGVSAAGRSEGTGAAAQKQSAPCAQTPGTWPQPASGPAHAWPELPRSHHHQPDTSSSRPTAPIDINHVATLTDISLSTSVARSGALICSCAGRRSVCELFFRRGGCRIWSWSGYRPWPGCAAGWVHGSVGAVVAMVAVPTGRRAGRPASHRCRAAVRRKRWAREIAGRCREALSGVAELVRARW